MKKISSFSSVLFCLFITTIMPGQDNPVPVNGGPGIYLQTDASYYLTGKPILFKSYLLNSHVNIRSSVTDTLYVAIIDQEGIEVASGIFPFSKKVVLDEIEYPDFITDGKYAIIASTLRGISLDRGKIFSRILEIRKSYKSDLPKEPSLSKPDLNSGNLKIQIKSEKESFERKENVRLDIFVTDSKGEPIAANLSVTVSDLILGKNYRHSEIISGKDIKVSEIEKKPTESSDDETLFSPAIRNFFAQCLVKTLSIPGSQFVAQEKNSIKKLYNYNKSLKKESMNGYPSDRNVLDILMRVKPYHIENGKIFFGTSSLSSFNNQEGALIIVDGIKMGTDINILSTLPVPDIAKITASTNTMDIQKYSSMNTAGIVEIYMKKNAAYKDKTGSAFKAKTSNIFWAPDITTDTSGKTSVNFINNTKSTDVTVTVDGITENGLYGTSTIRYSVK